MSKSTKTVETIVIPEDAKREDVTVKIVMTNGQSSVVSYAKVNGVFEYNCYRDTIVVTFNTVGVLESELNAWLALSTWAGRGEKTCVTTLLKNVKTQLETKWSQLGGERAKAVENLRDAIAETITIDQFVKKLVVDSCDNRGLLRVGAFDTLSGNYGSKYEYSDFQTEVHVYIRPSDDAQSVVTTYYVDDTFCRTAGYTTIEEALDNAYGRLDARIAQRIANHDEYVAKATAALKKAGYSLTDEN